MATRRCRAAWAGGGLAAIAVRRRPKKVVVGTGL